MRRHPKIPTGKVAAQFVANPQFQRKVDHLHRLGPRAVGEMLAHLGAKHSIQTSIEQTVDHFAELEPEALDAAGGNRFWPAPLYKIRRAP